VDLVSKLKVVRVVIPAIRLEGRETAIAGFVQPIKIDRVCRGKPAKLGAVAHRRQEKTTLLRLVMLLKSKEATA
jgi:hypothetical protein